MYSYHPNLVQCVRNFSYNYIVIFSLHWFFVENGREYIVLQNSIKEVGRGSSRHVPEWNLEKTSESVVCYSDN